MKPGKLSQTVWRRSVRKQLNTDSKVILLRPSAEEMCTAMQVSEGEAAVSTSATVSGSSEYLGIYAVAKALNDLATRGAKPVSIAFQILLPEDTEEAELKELIRQITVLCEQTGIPIAGIQAEVNPAVSCTIIVANAFGTVKPQSLIQVRNAGSGLDIVLCGYIGLEGMLRIMDENEAELAERFVPAFLHQMKELRSELVKLDAIRTASSCDVCAMQQIGSGGIFAALWEMAEAAGIGLKIDLQKISIKQETIEVCEYCHLNPYQMTSTGAILMLTKDGDALVELLEALGARASRLGVTTAENARVITSGEEQRFLDRPAPDELTRWQKRRGGLS